MLKLLIITLSVFSFHSFGEVSMQLGLGSLTPHFSGNKRNFCNQWNNTGIIVNKTYYLALFSDEFGFTYLRGNDSICSDIEGLFFQYLFRKGKWNDFGITVGGYAFNQSNWDEHAKKTPSGIAAPDPVAIDYFGRSVVPVLALSWGIHLIRSEKWSLKLNNLFTPVIFNHSIAYEYRF